MPTKMTVNEVDVSTCNARFWNITPGRRTISNSSEALDGSAVPLLLNPFFGMREYTIAIHVYGSTRETLFDNASKLLELFSRCADVKIESTISGNAADFKSRFFKLSLSGITHQEYGVQKAGWHVVTLTCLGYEYGWGLSRSPAHGALNFTGSGTIRTVEYESLFADMDINYARFHSPETTAPVTANIEIWQTNKYGADVGNLYPGVAGKEYPLNADITISGLCKNSYGKDVGTVTIMVRPDGHLYPGTGIKAITVDGQTGKYSTEANAGGSHTLEMDMPAPARVGFPDQRIGVKITAYDMAEHPQNIFVSFAYTPVYL